MNSVIQLQGLKEIIVDNPEEHQPRDNAINKRIEQLYSGEISVITLLLHYIYIYCLVYVVVCIIARL